MIPKPGDRVRVTGVMPNDPSPMPIGSEGTVEEVNAQVGQIYVQWDDPGRSLILLTEDPFVVIR